MNKTKAISGLIIIAGVVYFSLNMPSVYAETRGNGQGQRLGRKEMIAEKARILKMSESDLQNELNKGQTFYEIAKKRGIDVNSIHEQMKKFQMTRLQSLVDQGVITKEQMQERLDFMEKRQNNCGKNTPLRGNEKSGMRMMHR